MIGEHRPDGSGGSEKSCTWAAGAVSFPFLEIITEGQPGLFTFRPGAIRGFEAPEARRTADKYMR